MQSNVKHTNLGSSFVTPWNVGSWSRCEQTNSLSPEVKNLVPTRGKILIRFPTGKPLQLNTRLKVDTGLARSTRRKSVLSRYSQRCLSLCKPPWECKYSVIDGCTQFNRTNAFSRRGGPTGTSEDPIVQEQECNYDIFRHIFCRS